MATKIVTEFIDDLDGTTADRTVSFRIDGTEYDIDLSAANAAALRQLLAPYMSAGRKVTGKGRRTISPTRLAGPSPSNPSSIREWAERNGYSTGSRGRLPFEILEAHELATA
ncbi:histone-like nucleoid-structuring protein Lsr2 [Arthrobacter rhizosphaerae]|uniref:histone-like nucleoid-structuring protein Lsr2 n=1 Tax=Arthrobacter rhizosphaerae TaxID=2855490 RepID=UPI001FF54D34|nr:Lsr2 family protein [Arthrobacter rhizosphaerae]